MKRMGALLLLSCIGCGARAGNEPSTEPRVENATGAEVQTARAESQLASCCQHCPLALPGVELKFAPTTAGGSMMFSAPASELEELRQRVRQLAEHHNGQSQRLAMMTIPHQTEAVDIEGGAQLRMTTQINNDIQRLQTEIEQEVGWMRGGRCPGVGSEASCVCRLGTPQPASSSDSERTPPPQVTSPPAQEP